MENAFRDGLFGMAYRAFNGPVLANLGSQISRLRGQTSPAIRLDDIPTYLVEQWPGRTGTHQVLIPTESPFPDGTTFHIEPLVEYHLGNLLWQRFKWRLLTGVEAGSMIGVPVAIVAGYFHWV